MRYIRYFILAIIALILVELAFANSDLVTLTVFSDGLIPYVGWNVTVEVPLYVVGLGGLVVGLLIGFLWEWMRERHHRRSAAHGRRDKALLEAELRKLKAEQKQHDDEVLALIEQPKPAR